MKFLTHITILALNLSLSSCLFSASKSTEKNASGQALVTVQMGRIGALAKSSAIEMAVLNIVLTASGEAPVEKAFPLTGAGSGTVSAQFDGLASLKNWSLKAESRDKNGVVIHRGSSAFYVYPEKTAEISLELNAAYSMLQAQFQDIPDSVRKVELLVDGSVKDVYEASTGYLTGENALLAFDYLETSKDHEVVLNSWGSFWGATYLLYTGKSIVSASPGEDESYDITMTWVGPGAPPKGRATMAVKLGSIGKAVINAGYKKRQNNYKTENPK